jgi:hypothetical protein
MAEPSPERLKGSSSTIVTPFPLKFAGIPIEGTPFWTSRTASADVLDPQQPILDEYEIKTTDLKN